MQKKESLQGSAQVRHKSIHQKIRKVLAVLACITLLGMLLHGVSALVANKSALEEHLGFIEQKENFDVLFFGTSHVHSAISPMELWKREGIVSYNLSSPGCTVPMMYWMLRCALKHTSPKVVVVDCAYISRKLKGHDKSGYMHQAFDVFPISPEKIQAGFDLYEDPNDRMEMIWPFSTYHTRWIEISKDDFFMPRNVRKGGKIPFGVEAAYIPELDMNADVKMDGIGFEYLRRIREFCDQKKINLVLTYLPFEYSETTMKECIALKRYAEEYHMDYLDGNQLRSITNEKTDYQDSHDDNSHMNYSGMQKISVYIGKYLKEHYDVPDRKEDAGYGIWKNQYREYLADKWNTFTKQKNIYNWLMMASDLDLDVVIEMDGSDYLQDMMCSALLENLGADPEKMKEQIQFAVISGDGRKDQYLTADGGETFLGRIQLNRNPGEEMNYRVDLNHLELYPMSGTEKSYVRITLLYGEAHEVVGSALFTYSMTDAEGNLCIKAKREV